MDTPEKTAMVSEKDAVALAEKAITKVVAEKDAQIKELAEGHETAMKSINDQMAEFRKSLNDDARFSSKEDRMNAEKKSFVVNHFKAMMKAKDDPEAKKSLHATHEEMVSKGLVKKTMSTFENGACLVHPEFARDIIKCMDRCGALENIVSRYEMQGNEWRGCALISEAVAGWRAECTAFSECQLKFDQISLGICSLGCIFVTCNELFEDNMTDVDLYDLMVEAMVKAIRQKVDEAILFGNGEEGKCEIVGIANATTKNGFIEANGYIGGGINEIVTAGQTFNSITLTDLVNAQACVSECFIGENPMWVMNRKAKKQLSLMVDCCGRPLLLDSFATQNETDVLLGDPIYTTCAIQDPLNTEEDADTPFIFYGDWKAFTLTYKGGLRTKVSEDGSIYVVDTDGERLPNVSLLQENKSAFRVFRRVGGGVTVPAAFSVIRTAALSFIRTAA